MSKNSDKLNWDEFDLTYVERENVKSSVDLPYKEFRQEISDGRVSGRLTTFFLGLFWAILNQLISKISQDKKTKLD